MKVNGFYISEWDDGIEIVSEAVINLDTKEVIIGEHLYDYDFDQMDLEVFDRQYVTIDGIEYDCCHKSASSENDYWYRQKGD